MARLVVIDNYDSFTYNLVHLFLPLGIDVEVCRSHGISIDGILAKKPDCLLIGPGPRDPAHAGISKALIEQLHRTIPILGVCLGMQCLNEVFGGRTIRAGHPVHGKTSAVSHNGTKLFAHVPSPFKAARYHSLVADPAPESINTALSITATASDGEIMGLSHRHFPLHGVQFHPESFLTEHGSRIAENFLKIARSWGQTR